MLEYVACLGAEEGGAYMLIGVAMLGKKAPRAITTHTKPYMIALPFVRPQRGWSIKRVPK